MPKESKHKIVYFEASNAFELLFTLQWIAWVGGLIKQYTIILYLVSHSYGVRSFSGIGPKLGPNGCQKKSLISRPIFH